MKKLLLPLFIGLFGITISQNNITLNITHHFDGEALNYDTDYTSWDGKAIKITRVQYYMSSFVLTHDGGQTTELTDTYVLASGNISNYSLGTADVNSIEGINFDVGVDETANSIGISAYPNGHPLAAQSPTMDWGWPSGYFFLVIDGYIDDKNDGIPNKLFQFHALGNNLLTPTSVNTSSTENNGNIEINMYANVADWLRDIDAVNNGFQHDGGIINQQLCANTNTHTVFEAGSSMSLVDNFHNEILYVDCSLAYAPTIYYSFNTLSTVDLFIVDMNGRVVLQTKDLKNEGNFFINKELSNGIYIASFLNNDGLKKTIKFSVRN